MRVNDSGPSTARASEAEPDAVRARLYDARRDIHYVKPLLRGWQHVVWFGLSLVAGTLTITHTHGASRIAAVAAYASTVTGLFGASALYHRGNWSPTWSRRLQRLDHLMIFFLIAGTATPAFVIAMPGRYGLICLIVLWTLALTAT